MSEDFKEAAEIQLVAALQLQNATSELSITLTAMATQTNLIVMSFKLLSSQITQIGTLMIRKMGLPGVAQNFQDIFQVMIRGMKNLPAFSGGSVGGGARVNSSGSLSKSSGGVINRIKESVFEAKLGKGSGAKATGGLGGIGREVAGAAGFISGIGREIGRPIKRFGSTMKKSNVGSLGKQMLKLNLVIRPLTSFFQGFLEPLEPLTDIFGAVGSIMSIGLVPAMNQLYNLMLPALPSLIKAMTDLQPIFEGFGEVLAGGVDPLTWSMRKLRETLDTANDIAFANARKKELEDALDANFGFIPDDEFSVSSGQYAAQKEAQERARWGT